MSAVTMPYQQPTYQPMEQSCTSKMVETLIPSNDADRPGETLYVTYRTMDLSENTCPILYKIPSGCSFQSRLPNDHVHQPSGHSWSNKYGFIGISPFGGEHYCHGLNAQGFYIAANTLDCSQYQDPTGVSPENILGIPDLPSCLLGNCETVEEAVSLLKGLCVVDSKIGPVLIGGYHFHIADRFGNNRALEYLEGKLSVSTPKSGVVTNDPAYSYFEQVEKYYTSQNPTVAPDWTVNGNTITSDGPGSSAIGLPGGYTPTARHVNSVYNSCFILKINTRDAIPTHSFDHMARVWIPLGVKQKKAGDDPVFTKTQWIAAATLEKNGMLFFFARWSMKWEGTELNRLDFNPGAPIERYNLAKRRQPTYEDITGKFKQVKRTREGEVIAI